MSNEHKKLSVILPIYNEGNSLSNFVHSIYSELERVYQTGFELILVDDGSERFPEINIDTEECLLILHHQSRQGSGASRKTGSRMAQGHCIAWMDADETYSIEDLLHLVCELKDADQIIGERKTDHGNLKVLRFFAKKLSSKTAEWLWKHPIPDINSGLRVFKREKLLIWLDELPDGFSCTTTATLAALNHGQNIRFFPISYKAREENSKSKFHPIFDTLKLWRAIACQWIKKREQTPF